MKSKSLSLINKLEEERRRLRLEEGKKYAEQKRRYLLKQENDRRLNAIKQKEDIKDKLLSLKETTRKLASVPVPETPLKKLVEIRNSLSQDIDRIIADNIDNEALRYAIIDDEVSVELKNELNDSINLKSLEIQENISSGIPLMSVARIKTRETNSNKNIANTKINPSKPMINRNAPTSKPTEYKKLPVTQIKNSLTRRVNDPARIQRNNTYVTKSNPSKNIKNTSKYDKDSSLLDMLETREHNSFARVSNLRENEKTKQVKYYDEVPDSLRMSSVIHQSMNSVVSEVARLSMMLDDLNKDIEQKMSSDSARDIEQKTINIADNVNRTKDDNSVQVQKAKQDELMFIDYNETFDDTVNYCDDDEVQRRSFDKAEELVDDGKLFADYNSHEPRTTSPSKDVIMKNIVEKLHKSISSEAHKNIVEMKSIDKIPKIRDDIKHEVADLDESEVRPYPFLSNKYKFENEEIVTEDLNLFPFPLYNDKRINDDNAQYQRLETLQDPQTRAELGYLHDRKLIMHDYGNDFVVKKILDSTAHDNIPPDSGYDQFSKTFIKNTLDSIDNEGKREMEKVIDSDSDVKITSHILPSGQQPTVTWSSTYGLLPSLRNIGELAGMISSDYDDRSCADYVVTDEESFSDDDDHCIVNIAASEMAKKKAEEKREVRVSSEKSSYPHKSFSTYIEEVDIKNESIAETSVNSEEDEEEFDCSTSNGNINKVFNSALNIEISISDINEVINTAVDNEMEPQPINSSSADSHRPKAPSRLSPTELRQVMLYELRKQDEILNYELELSELEQAHTIQSASNIVERFINSKELEVMESKKQQELSLHQQAYEMSLTTALLNAQMIMHSESTARNEIIVDLQSQMRDQELNQDYANLISCTSQMVELFQQPVPQPEIMLNESKVDAVTKPVIYNDSLAPSEKIHIAKKEAIIASPIRSSQQNTSTSSSIIDEVADLKFTPIKKVSNREDVFSPSSDYYSDEFEDIEDDEVSEDIIGYVSPRETKSVSRSVAINKNESRSIRAPTSSNNDNIYDPKVEITEFSKTFKEFESEINNRKMMQEKKLMVQSQLSITKRDKYLNRIQEQKRNAEENPSMESRSLISNLINEEKQVREKYLESTTIIEREKWSINAIYYRDLRKLRQMQLDYEFCGGMIDFDGNRDLVNASLSSRRSSSSKQSLYNQDNDEDIEEINDEEYDRKNDASMDRFSVISSKLGLSPKSKQSMDDAYEEDFDDYRDKDITIQSIDSKKLISSSPQKITISSKNDKKPETEYQSNDNYFKEIESIEESIAEHQNRIKIIKQNIIGIETDDKQLDTLLKKKEEKERLANEEARLFKSLNDKLEQISSSKEIASKSNVDFASKISSWVQSIREPFAKTIEMLQEEDSLDDSSWCSDIAEVQPTKLPMRLDTYIEKRVKHKFSALLIQKVTRGWLLRKKGYIMSHTLTPSGDLGFQKFRGDLVKEHAVVVAVEDLILEDSFNSDNGTINFEGQFYNEQKQLQKQMEKVEEMSNILTTKTKLDFQINEALTIENAKDHASSINTVPSQDLASIELQHPPSDSISLESSPNRRSDDETHRIVSPVSPSKSPAKTAQSPKQQVTSPLKSPVKSPSITEPKEDIVLSSVAESNAALLSVNSPEQTLNSPAQSQFRENDGYSEVHIDDSLHEPQIEKSALIAEVPASNPAYDGYSEDSTDDSFQKSPVAKSVPVAKELVNPASDNHDESSTQVDNSVEDSGYNSVEEVLEASEIMEDDFEKEDDDEEKNITVNIQNNSSKDYSDEEIDEEDIINDLSSPGKAIILDDSDNIDDEVEFDDYSVDQGDDEDEKQVDNKNTSLASLSGIPPLISNKPKPESNEVDFEELYDFDDKASSLPELSNIKVDAPTKTEVVDAPTINWVDNVDAFFSHILDEVDMLAVIANLENPSFNKKFIPANLFETIYRNFQHEYNLADHCRAVFDRVNDLLTELHQLRHNLESTSSDMYTSVLIAKSMVLNGKNVRHYVHNKIISDQKIQGIMPEVKVNLDMIEASAQSNLNKAADELTDIILARVLIGISKGMSSAFSHNQL